MSDTQLEEKVLQDLRRQAGQAVSLDELFRRMKEQHRADEAQSHRALIHLLDRHAIQLTADRKVRVAG